MTNLVKDKGNSSPNQKYPCHFCNKTFKINSKLMQHIKRVHEKEDEKQKDFCDICKIKFDSENLLMIHFNDLHEGLNVYQNKIVNTFNCDLCDKSFGKKRSLQIHKSRIHNSLKEKDQENIKKGVPKKSPNSKKLEFSTNVLENQVEDIDEDDLKDKENFVHKSKKSNKRKRKLGFSTFMNTNQANVLENSKGKKPNQSYVEVIHDPLKDKEIVVDKPKKINKQKLGFSNCMNTNHGNVLENIKEEFSNESYVEVIHDAFKDKVNDTLQNHKYEYSSESNETTLNFEDW